MYLFDLDMSNIKSKGLAQEGTLKNSAELTGKQLCAGVSFIIMKVQGVSFIIMKVQASWIKSNFYVHILPGTGVFQ